MIAGHTRTENMPAGKRGAIRPRFRGRYIGIDVTLRDDDPTTWTALVVDAKGGHEWRYRSRERRPLWS